LCWWTKETLTPSDIGEGLIDRKSFDEGSVIAHHIDGGVTQPFVLLEVAADETKLRTELAGPSPRHATPDSESLCFIRSGEHNSAADGNRLAAQ